MTTRQYIILMAHVEDRKRAFTSKRHMQHFIEERISEAESYGTPPGLVEYGKYLWSISTRSYRSLWTQAWNEAQRARSQRAALKRFFELNPTRPAI